MEGFVIVRTHVYQAGPEDDPGSAADVEVFTDYTVPGLAGEAPLTGLQGPEP
jgi:hypothetical protein